MTKDRIAQLEADVYTHIFQMLDAEPDVDGLTAGRIARIASKRFEHALTVWAEPLERI